MRTKVDENTPQNQPSTPENRQPQAWRDAAGKFLSGQSPNPGGRPKGEAEVRALAQAHGPEAIHGLIRIARSPKTQAAVKVSAWRELLDRGYGRAPQSLDVTVRRSLEDVLAEVAAQELDIAEPMQVAALQTVKES